MPPLASPRAVAGFPDLATRADRQVSIPRPPDGLGRRRLVAMDLANVSWHRYDLGWNVLGDYAAGGGSWGVGARVNSYQWNGMTPLAETSGANPGTGATRHHLHDHLGSTRALFDGGKARLARLDYAPHGQPRAMLGAAANRSFTGKQYDAGIGMYHFPHRHYSPSHARWMTRDPLGMVDGPNVYAYVRGAAVTAVDPLGLSSLAFQQALRCNKPQSWERCCVKWSEKRYKLLKFKDERACARAVVSDAYPDDLDVAIGIGGGILALAAFCSPVSVAAGTGLAVGVSLQYIIALQECSSRFCLQWK